MKKVILCTMTRNHLRFLIPMIEYICNSGHEVLLYTNFGEVIKDSLSYKINQFAERYENFYVMNIDQESSLIDYATDANSMLVTSGTSNIYLVLIIIYVKKFLVRLLQYSTVFLKKVLLDWENTILVLIMFSLGSRKKI